MSQLKVLKLVNGDEVIGFVDDGRDRLREDDEEGMTTDNLIFIKGPMRIVQEYDRAGRGHQLFLIDWMPSGGSNVLPIPKDKIITMDYPGSSIEEHYLELMGIDEEEIKQISPEEKKKQTNIELLKKKTFTDDEMN